MLKQLRIKFVAVTMSLIALLLCVLMLLLFFFTATALDAEVSLKMQTVTESLSHRGLPPDRPLFDNRLHYFILTETSRGDILAIGTETFDCNDSTTLQTLYRNAMSSEDSSGIITEYALKYLHVPNMNSTVVFADISNELAALRMLSRHCILVTLAALLLFGLLTVKLAAWMIKPVETAWEQQRQFVADASHELKTPLTVIMTNTEMLTSPEYSPAEKSRFVENTAEMTKRMRFLVEGMLDLARVDNGIVKNAMEVIDYSALNEQCTLPFEPLFFESDRFLLTEITPNIRLNGSATHLAQVTDILLDNAIKYSAPYTETRLTLTARGKHALLCVDSMGDALSQEQLEQIFHRFYTVDQARTGSSYGLGLSIAKGIVEEHGGKIWAESTNGHNRFYVKLPL